MNPIRWELLSFYVVVVAMPLFSSETECRNLLPVQWFNALPTLYIHIYIYINQNSTKSVCLSIGKRGAYSPTDRVIILPFILIAFVWVIYPFSARLCISLCFPSCRLTRSQYYAEGTTYAKGSNSPCSFFAIFLSLCVTRSLVLLLLFFCVGDSFTRITWLLGYEK